MYLVHFPGRRFQVRNRDHRTLNIAVHRPYLCQLHHHHCSLDKFSLCPSASDILWSPTESSGNALLWRVPTEDFAGFKSNSTSALEAR
jgi:hypothetical protein